MKNNVTSILKNAKAVFPLTDLGNAERFAAQHRDRARYVGAWRTWLVWDGKRWEPDTRGSVGLLAKLTARSIDIETQHEPDADKKKLLRTHATKTESRAGLENMLALARAELAAAPDDFDKDGWLLNVANGTIDLRTGKLRPHRREDMHTRVLDVDYDAAATCPTFEGFIARALGGNAELVTFVRKAVGYSLTGDVTEQVFFFLHGEGANGKSTLAEVLMRLLGPYAKAGAPDLLMQREQEQHLTWIAELAGARLVVCQEIAEGKSWNERTLKQLTGGDRLIANKMHRDPFEFTPSHKLWICGNTKPKMREGGLATWRRVRLVPFLVTIPTAERDRDLGKKLASEQAGILRWAVDGCIEWQRDGLAPPNAVVDATNGYREESDHVQTFVDDRIALSPTGHAGKSETYAAYTLWCKHNRETPLSRGELTKRLLARLGVGGVSEHRDKRGMQWTGFELRSSSQAGGPV